MQNIVDRINLRTMRSGDVVAHYARASGLAPHEKAALDRVADRKRRYRRQRSRMLPPARHRRPPPRRNFR